MYTNLHTVYSQIQSALSFWWFLKRGKKVSLRF